MGLCQLIRVVLVIAVWALQQSLAIPNDPLLGDPCATLVVLIETEIVLPPRRSGRSMYDDSQLDIGKAPGGEAAYCTHSTPETNGFLKASAGGRQLPQETECVEEVRLSCGVRPHQEHTIGYCHLAQGEVLPVLQPEA